MYLFLTSSNDIEGSMALCRKIKKNFAAEISVEIRRTYLSSLERERDMM